MACAEGEGLAMTITYNKFNSFIEALAEKAHNLGSDALTVALTDTAPVATNTVLANITEVAYTYCSSRVLTVSASAQTSGTYKLTVADITLTATGGDIGPFRYVVIYNDTATNNELICWFDLAIETTVSDGLNITINFDGTNGMLTIG